MGSRITIYDLWTKRYAWRVSLCGMAAKAIKEVCKEYEWCENRTKPTHFQYDPLNPARGAPALCSTFKGFCSVSVLERFLPIAQGILEVNRTYPSGVPNSHFSPYSWDPGIYFINSPEPIFKAYVVISPGSVLSGSNGGWGIAVSRGMVRAWIHGTVSTLICFRFFTVCSGARQGKRSGFSFILLPKTSQMVGSVLHVSLLFFPVIHVHQEPKSTWCHLDRFLMCLSIWPTLLLLPRKVRINQDFEKPAKPCWGYNLEYNQAQGPGFAAQCLTQWPTAIFPFIRLISPPSGWCCRFFFFLLMTLITELISDWIG